ncbi:hypothetical protein N7466_006357 [Penicillium verhagenii]|uniref:uncharacterized protein n=1 Tax=Penicillium verhagenii TaxID=1562060 RepID=UPI00254584CE|nr:uncharacterized protein N7466_006357 [Penicillium verhagenii]KAJ5930864.1 hypothetical protein N7466_006357 [Penicillium verhagenii]
MSFQAHLGPIPTPLAIGANTEHESLTSAGGSTQSKPIRLALACNQCRKRKVRCDAQQPKCRNCSVRGDLCETSDPRNSGDFPAVRRRAMKRWNLKTRPKAGPVLSPVYQSPGTRTPVTLSSINSVLNPTVPIPANQVDQASPDSRRASKSSPIAASSVSQDSSSRRTNHSERLGEDHFSWQSRAYQESTEAHVQEVTPGQCGTEQVAIETSPDEIVTTDDTGDKTCVSVDTRISSFHGVITRSDLDLICKSTWARVACNALSTLYGFGDATPLFKHGMLHAEEFPMPIIPKLVLLPTPQRLSTYIDAFFTRLWPLYPVIERSAFEEDINKIVCLGSNIEYLTAGHCLHGHLTAIPSTSTVQALFLLSLALKSAARAGQAWQVAGHAVRMAQSIGLHKLIKVGPSTQAFTIDSSPASPDERLWWSCFALEKLMQLEYGRPSIIDRSYDSLSVCFSMDVDLELNFPYFRAWVALGSIMGRISNRLYFHRFMGGSAEILGLVAELDQELTEWANYLPDPLKPHITYPVYARDEQRIISTFLAQQYHHAQLSILRITLLFPQKSLEKEITKHMKIIPNHSRLLSGASICANAARSIITQSLQLADSRLQSTLLPAPPTYLATVILGLGILRQPNNRLVRSDVELLASATEFVETWYLQWGFSHDFTQTCTDLRERVVSIFQNADGSTRKPFIESSAKNISAITAGQQLQLDNRGSMEHGICSNLEDHITTDDNNDLFGSFGFEDFCDMSHMMDFNFETFDGENMFFALDRH